MKFLDRVSNLGFVLLFCLSLVSCGQSSGGSNSSPSIQTIQWQLDGNGFVQFSTNDSQYYAYSFWNTYSQTSQTTMSTVTAAVKKQSGNAGSGYGIVFCYQDNNNFYRILIETSGHYLVSARVGGTYSTIIPWTASANLNSGFGAENSISVTQLSAHYFAINFNGTQETTFSDGNFTGGRSGFYSYISDQTHENFPYTPSDARFKMSSPVTYP